MRQPPEDLDLARVANRVDHRTTLQPREDAQRQRTRTVLGAQVNPDADQVIAAVVQSAAGRLLAHGIRKGMDIEP